MSELVIRVRAGDKAKELARSLMLKIPNFSCPACGHRDFALLEQPELALRTVLSREFLNGDNSEIGVVPRQPLITILCTNCGHVEQFAEVIIQGARKEEYGPAVGDEQHHKIPR